MPHYYNHTSPCVAGDSKHNTAADECNAPVALSTVNAQLLVFVVIQFHGDCMNAPSERKIPCLQLIIERLFSRATDTAYWKARRVFESDPKLQVLHQRIQESTPKAEQQAEEYYHKYDCIEPQGNTVKLESFKEMRSRERR